VLTAQKHLKANGMIDFKSSHDRFVETKRWSLVSLSVLSTCWLLILVIARGMFGSQGGETEAVFTLRIIFYSLLAGCIMGLLWGSTDLRKIEIVMVPAGVFLGIVLITSPFMLYETITNPPDVGVAYALLGFIAVIGMFFSMMLFPVFGPAISYALWNNKQLAEMRDELGRVLNNFRALFMPKR